MKKALKWIALLAVAGLLVAGATASYLGGRVVEVEVTKPDRGEIVSTVEETGKVRLDRWQWVCAQTGGVLGPVDFEPGAAVASGQTLATLEDVRVRESIAQARASIKELEARIEGLAVQEPREPEIRQAALAVRRAEKALEVEKRTVERLQAELDQIRKDLERQQTLTAGGSLPEAEVERFETRRDVLEKDLANQDTLASIAAVNLDIAREGARFVAEREHDAEPMRDAYRAGIERLRSEIAVLETERARTKLAAPFDGVILERATRGHTYVAPGTPVLRVGDPGSVEVEVDLLSDDLPKVVEGGRVVVSGKAIGDLRLQGRVHKIYPEAFTKISSLGIEQQRVKVVVRTDETPPALKPGVSVDVSIEADRVEAALRVPEKSVFSKAGEDFVFVVRDGKLALAKVETGLSDDRFLEIRSGLSETDRVVLNPDITIEPGRPAKVANEEASE